MPRLLIMVVLMAALTATGCFEDAQTTANCNPGAEACGCDDGVCQAGLTCIDNICSSDSGSSRTGGASTSPISETVTAATTQTSDPSTSGDTTRPTDPGSSTLDTATSSVDSTTSAVDSTTSSVDSTTSSSSGEPLSHVMFVTQAQFAGRQIGSLEAADALCEQASVEGTPHMAILSDAASSPADRIEIVGPVFNTVGQQVAADAEELWSGTAAADVGFDENEDPISASDLAWVGSAGANCQDWNTAVFNDQGAFGVPTQADQWLVPGDTFQCGLDLHLYCVSI